MFIGGRVLDIAIILEELVGRLGIAVRGLLCIVELFIDAIIYLLDGLF